MSCGICGASPQGCWLCLHLSTRDGLALAGVKFFTVAGAVFGFCTGNGVDNSRIFLLLLNRA